MRKFTLSGAAAVIAAIALQTVPAQAATNDAGSLGLGFTSGGGLTGKYWLDPNAAIDFGANLGFNFTPAFSIPLGVRAGYLMHDYDLIKLDSGQLPLYYGGGVEVGLGIGSPFTSGMNLYGAIGFDYLLKDAPIDFFLEANPRIAIPSFSPFAMGVNFGGTLGVRYYFDGAKKKTEPVAAEAEKAAEEVKEAVKEETKEEVKSEKNKK